MKYIWTLIWSFFLSEMVSYVGGAMTGVPFSFNDGLILTGIFFVITLLVTTVIPDEPVAHHE